MELSNEISVDGIIQGLLVLALVVVTFGYFLQTRKQAKALENQISIMKNREIQTKKEKILDDIISWASSINKWNITERAYKINDMDVKDNLLLKSLILSNNCQIEFTHFIHNGTGVILPKAETLDQESLITAIELLISDMREYFNFLQNEKRAMINDLNSGNKVISETVLSLQKNTAEYGDVSIPVNSQMVIEQAEKLKLII